MEDYRERYNKLKKEYDDYQTLVEAQIQKLSRRNMKLEKDLNALDNIVQISKYINSFLSDKNLILMINDMIVGLLGVTNSIIYLDEKEKLVPSASNVNVDEVLLIEKEEDSIRDGRSYLVNSMEPIRTYSKESMEIHSVMGMPIKIRDKFIGFIIVEHTLYNYLDLEHEVFLRSIANQIAIAIENSILYRELQDSVKKDPLLGIYNRRYFLELIDSRSKEKPNGNYAIVMVDLDNFKRVNDTYGHQCGDEVLISTSKVIKNMLEPEDIFARYGGEELIIYINRADNVREVYERVETIRGCLENNVIGKDNISMTITASFGIGYYPRNASNLNDVIKVADRLLYRSKSLGKNMVLISDFLM